MYIRGVMHPSQDKVRCIRSVLVVLFFQTFDDPTYHSFAFASESEENRENISSPCQMHTDVQLYCAIHRKRVKFIQNVVVVTAKITNLYVLSEQTEKLTLSRQVTNCRVFRTCWSQYGVHAMQYLSSSEPNATEFSKYKDKDNYKMRIVNSI